MCGCSCSTQRSEQAEKAKPANSAGLTLRVEDMTCGHCAGTIRTAIETGMPGTRVEADPVSKLVSVQGSTDLTSIKAIVTEAGYTPSDAA